MSYKHFQYFWYAMKVKNIYEDLPSKIPAEILENIFQNDKIRIERIISKGQASPPAYWYNQNQNEWVIVLKGSAKLLFKGDVVPVIMNEGDYMNIIAHTEHRVEYTDSSTETIWLAVFY